VGVVKKREKNVSENHNKKRECGIGTLDVVITLLTLNNYAKVVSNY
jgi:hypothetical protein